MGERYKHSGKFTIPGLASGLVAGIVTAIPVGFLYVFGIWSIPDARLRGVCTLAFGAIVGASCGWALCLVKVRNSIMSGTIAAISSLFALYISWVIWVLHLMFPSYWILNPIRLALQPRVLWKIIVSVNAEGTWAFKGSTPTTGTGLWVVWLGEAGLLIGFAVMAAVAMTKRQPFCERCEDWCAGRSKLYFAPSVSPSEIKAHVEAADVSWIAELQRGHKEQAHFRLDLDTCETCNSLTTLSLVQGFPRDRKTLVDKLMLSADQSAAIRNLCVAHEAQARSPIATASPSIP